MRIRWEDLSEQSKQNLRESYAHILTQINLPHVDDHFSLIFDYIYHATERNYEDFMEYMLDIARKYEFDQYLEELVEETND